MSAGTIQRMCSRHLVLFPAGEACPECRALERRRGAVRRHANHKRLGRYSTHWRELSFRMIRRHRATLGAICPSCGGAELESDPGSKLTLDLVRGGDHRTAREDECEVKCRRCHGRQQGGRGAPA